MHMCLFVHVYVVCVYLYACVCVVCVMRARACVRALVGSPEGRGLSEGTMSAPHWSRPVSMGCRTASSVYYIVISRQPFMF